MLYSEKGKLFRRLHARPPDHRQHPWQTPFDLIVIGGGVNGAGSPATPPGRGAKVLLLEARDLASGTSSASTKLVHGGLRYLEYYEFALVREALAEREVLWGIAPHLVRPLRFVLPWMPHLRPRWMLRLGLFLYDYIGGRKRLPDADTDRLARHPAGAPLKPGIANAGSNIRTGWVDDARLVVLNALDAAERGAEVRTRTRSPPPARRRSVAGRNAARARFAAARWSTPAGPGADGVAQLAGPGTAVQAAAGARLAYRGAEAVRPSLRLHLPAARHADLLRDSLRARLHPDRHHRPRPSRVR